MTDCTCKVKISSDFLEADFSTFHWGKNPCFHFDLASKGDNYKTLESIFMSSAWLFFCAQGRCFVLPF